jgi:hypothetical protein
VGSLGGRTTGYLSAHLLATFVAMVCLALEPEAASEAIRLATSTGWSVWVGSDAITQEEHQQFSGAGLRITRFVYPLAEATPELVADVLGEIEEHHPNEIIWVQHIRSGTQI